MQVSETIYDYFHCLECQRKYVRVDCNFTRSDCFICQFRMENSKFCRNSTVYILEGILMIYEILGFFEENLEFLGKFRFF